MKMDEDFVLGADEVTHSDIISGLDYISIELLDYFLKNNSIKAVFSEGQIIRRLPRWIA